MTTVPIQSGHRMCKPGDHKGRPYIGSNRERPRRHARCKRIGIWEGEMTNRRVLPHLAFAVAAATFSLVIARRAAELDPAAVAYVTPDQFKWRDPAGQAATNQTILHGDPNKPELYIYINTFKPGRFGNPHYHPNDRFITVIDGASWRGTGPVLDPAHAARVPKGTFMIDHAMKVHWGGNKEEGGSYLIAGIGPGASV